MIDNGSLKEAVRGHYEQDISNQNERDDIRKDISEIQERLKALEEQK
jgi:hypothetical protein